jgi:hypothetical protein
MQRALESAIGRLRRSISASWMLVFLMPADVRRSLKMPPVSITAEKTPAASENHRGRRRGRSLLSGHESSGGSRGDATSSAESHGRGRRWATRHRSAGIHRARVGEADSCRLRSIALARYEFGHAENRAAARVTLGKSPRCASPPKRGMSIRRGDRHRTVRSSRSDLCLDRGIARHMAPCPRQAGFGPSSPRCHEPVGPSPEIGNEIPTRETQMS